MTEKKAESWKLLFRLLRLDFTDLYCRYQEQRKKHKMRTVQVNTGVSVNWLTGWRMMQPGLSDARVFFLCAQDRQESTELIDAEIDGEHEEENKYQQ